MATKKSLYQPASAHICGIALLLGVSSVPGKPCTALLKAAFWNGDEPVVCLLRYFNEGAAVFEPDEKYFICATVRCDLKAFTNVTLTLIIILDRFI